MAISISRSLRLKVFCGVRKKPRESCMVMSRSALPVTALAQIDQRRFHQAKVVDSAVLEEAAIFDGEHRVHQHRRDVFET